MTLNTKSWDASEQLDSPEMITEYLKVMLEENGIEGLKKALGDVARAKGMTAVADETGLNRQNLYKSLSESGNPSLETVQRTLETFGCSLSVRQL